jgi:hypothetical protein
VTSKSVCPVSLSFSACVADTSTLPAISVRVDLLHIHRQSAYLIGRDRTVTDIPLEHPSSSKQHAVIQCTWFYPLHRDVRSLRFVQTDSFSRRMNSAVRKG